jgi:very-short-patch-repair endonuclease
LLPLLWGEGWGEGRSCELNEAVPTSNALVVLARRLRAQSTDAESLIWRFLRSRQLGGAKFRRQYPLGPYILDFCCEELKLVIEIDGGQHFEPEQAQKDKKRTRFLEARGLRVLRFDNHQVLTETEGVLTAIWNEIRRSQLLPSP